MGSACSLIFSISLAYSSDRQQERGLHIALGYLVGAGGLLWLALAPSNVEKWTLYGKIEFKVIGQRATNNELLGGVVWTQMGMGSAQAINAAWLTVKMEDYKRPVALAAYVMSIQMANFLGSQLFRTQGTFCFSCKSFARSRLVDRMTYWNPDAPRYIYGLVIAASCTIAATIVALLWKALYRYFDGEKS